MDDAYLDHLLADEEAMQEELDEMMANGLPLLPGPAGPSLPLSLDPVLAVPADPVPAGTYGGDVGAEIATPPRKQTDAQHETPPPLVQAARRRIKRKQPDLAGVYGAPSPLLGVSPPAPCWDGFAPENGAFLIIVLSISWCSTSSASICFAQRSRRSAQNYQMV